MRDFILSTETACDLSPELISKLDLSIMPMNYYINGEEFNSATSSLTTIDICNKMRSGATTKTSQPNEAEVEDYLKGLVKSGKNILHLSFSSAMSGTCATFKKVAEELNKTNENQIYVVDTLCQSAGLGLLLTMVNEKANSENLAITQVVEYAEKIKSNIAHFFIVEDLKYLARGGRISPTLATIGNIIKLKPVLHLDTTGKIVQHHKVLGRKKSMSELVSEFNKNFNNDSKKVYICEADCINDAEQIKSQLLSLNPTLEITVMPLGSIIVSHAGPGTIALFFTTDERR